jgi:hypothetical protein
MSFRRRFMITVVAGIFVAQADAAQIKVISNAKLKCPVVRVKGTLLPGDAQKFSDAVVPFKKIVVEFESEGGTIYDGLVIGKLINASGNWTVVRTGKTCASACAIAWLGGTRRFAEKGAKIGFHAAYVTKKKRAEESGIANAIVGAYLTRLGLNEDAVAYVTTSGPWQMTWLTPKAAREVGIEVTFGSPPDKGISGSDKKVSSAPFSSLGKEKVAQSPTFGDARPNSKISTKQIYDRIAQEQGQGEEIDPCAH